MPRDLQCKLEAVLFVAGEPVQAVHLARVLSVTEEEIARSLDDLGTAYEQRGAGLRVARSPEGVQLVTAPQARAAVETFTTARIRERLTPAAAETLAIIAYRGPISRAAIEAIRGVNSVFTLRLLAIRGLVQRKTHPTDQRRFLYEISAEFLRHLGVTRPEELPAYAELRQHEGITRLAEAEDRESAVESSAG